ncbi:MAG: hypothetical protein CVV44_13165 [Spirochaetae bacterium HGW-Spirochaetae-1]|jgi:hypothetical protein|nr:MAG: hypothetical protein CVV44_13165 [Spirochaetae bacterium HGW-Spirochaetae-1]
MSRILIHKKMCTISLVLALLMTPVFAGVSQDFSAGDNALTNYFTLMTIYGKWREGLFGSRKYYERELWIFLTDLIHKEIETESDFILVFPESLQEKRVTCIFKYSRWLYFHGEIAVDALAPIIKKDPDLLKKWWRSGTLVTVSGRVKKFRIGRDTYGNTINIWLEKVVVKE